MPPANTPNLTTPRDPRVYFSAERTLLSWISTSLGMMGMGFVVARFALFVKLMGPQSPQNHPRGISMALGIGLVIVGSITIVLAAV